MRRRVLERILVVIDASTASSAAAAAAELAHRAGDVLAVSVVDVQKCCAGGEEDVDDVQRRLAEVVGRLREAGMDCSGQIQRVVNRNVSFGLLSAVAEFRPTLVIIGTDHAPWWAAPLCDRPSLTMLRKAGCPVIVVP